MIGALLLRRRLLRPPAGAARQSRHVLRHAARRDGHRGARGLHRVDVQVHRRIQRHRRHPLHEGNQGPAGHHVQRRAGERRGTRRADRALPFRRPAADADRLPVPHDQPLRARLLGDHQVRERAVPLQRTRDDLRELVGRLQERRIQPALQRRAAGQRADLVRRGDRRNRSKSASSSIRSIRCASTSRRSPPTTTTSR